MAGEVSEQNEKKRGCTYVLIRFGIFVVCLYALQWVLQLAFEPSDSDVIAQSLKPFQNHYLSLSPHFVTVEGASTEFSDDTTAAGRFLTLLVPAVMIWLVIVVPVYLIKPLEKYQARIFWGVTILVFGSLMYSEFFVPHRKATFTDKDIELVETDWIFLRTMARIPYSSVEKFEYEFFKDHDVHTGDLLYARMHVLVGGKRFLLAENQLTPANDALEPTDRQRAETAAALAAMENLAKISPAGQ